MDKQTSLNQILSKLVTVKKDKNILKEMKKDMPFVIPILTLLLLTDGFWRL